MVGRLHFWGVMESFHRAGSNKKSGPGNSLRPFWDGENVPLFERWKGDLQRLGRKGHFE